MAGDAPYRTYNLCPTDFAIDLFTEEDARWDGTFMHTVYNRYYDFYDVSDHSSLDVFHYYAPAWASTLADSVDYAAANPDAKWHPYGSYSAQVVSSDYQTIPVRKFDDPSSPFGEQTGTRDIILARLADTYLLAAEAYLNAGDAGTALDRLNVVRQRSGVSDAPAGEFDIDYILDERGRELLGEYHRWFDLKRTGKLVERASAHHPYVSEENFTGSRRCSENPAAYTTGGIGFKPKPQL